MMVLSHAIVLLVLLLLLLLLLFSSQLLSSQLSGLSLLSSKMRLMGLLSMLRVSLLSESQGSQARWSTRS